MRFCLLLILIVESSTIWRLRKDFFQTDYPADPDRMFFSLLTRLSLVKYCPISKFCEYLKEKYIWSPPPFSGLLLHQYSVKSAGSLYSILQTCVGHMVHLPFLVYPSIYFMMFPFLWHEPPADLAATRKIDN